MIEVFLTYYIARARNWSKTNGAYEVWRDRNPAFLPHMLLVTLGHARRKIERKFSRKIFNGTKAKVVNFKKIHGI